jgi:hypothetical protein
MAATRIPLETFDDAYLACLTSGMNQCETIERECRAPPRQGQTKRMALKPDIITQMGIIRRSIVNWPHHPRRSMRRPAGELDAAASDTSPHHDQPFAK